MEYTAPSGATVLFESLWRTRYENDVPINEMESEHIVNTISYLEGQVEERRITGDREYVLPIVELPRTEHNVEVLKRELIRRTQ